MLALLYAYLCVPRGLRFVVRWLAMCFFVVVLFLVCLLFYCVLIRLPEHRGGFLHPEPHQPMSPDFIRHHPHRSVTLRRVRED